MSRESVSVISAPLSPAERSLAPDVARGAMLGFIAVANVSFYLWGRPLDVYGNIADAGSVDRVALFVEQLLMAERSRPMFAILYGFGIAVMASRATARGLGPSAVRALLARRSLWLIAFGVLHAALLFAGDVLAPYGATGLVALTLVLLPSAALRAWLWGTSAVVVLVTLPILAFLGSGASMDDATLAGEQAAGSEYLANVAYGLIASAAGIAFALLLLAYLPLVIVGILVQRAGWLERPAAHVPSLRRVFWSALVMNLVSSTPVALIALGVWRPSEGVAVVAGYLTLLGGMYAGLGYVCGFALLARRWDARGRRGVPGALAALGARSLTGYLGQSILLAPVLAPWGLGLGDGLGYLAAYGLAVGAWLVTVVVAVLLERQGLRGPFEVLLRRLTYPRTRT
ncbi:DUF418 domain-containing protein [Oerskovia flava]|uniref:DUF418 domain-containing protein n=1 Tax=Oerskovia flava TaxID=2986422 RepID=UPI00223FD1FD|nr:DUF418 domain-containing protein [Oerskovia sp. JB1-3-2]